MDIPKTIKLYVLNRSIVYESYINKAIILKRWRDEEALIVDMEGAGAWDMSSKLRELHVQRPCGWRPGMFKKAKKTMWQELMGQRGKGERRSQRAGWARLPRASRAMAQPQVRVEAERTG